ncbi:hypothetical protein [Salinispira pacifica]
MQAHIVRIEAGSSPCWQVRFNLSRKTSRSYRSKTFYDSHFGGKRKSRRAAEDYLSAELESAGVHSLPLGRRVGMKYPENPKRLLKNNLSGRTGVYRSEFTVTRPYGEQQVRFWAASYRIGPDGRRTNRSRRFYIGERSEREAKRLAVRFREGWEQAYLTGGVNGVKRFFREWDAERRKTGLARSDSPRGNRKGK